MDKEQTAFARSREHLANERTFLSWIRTSMGIMVFGFVVEKFSFFLREITYYLNKENIPDLTIGKIGYASHFGIFLVALGVFMGLFAFYNYRRIGRQLEESCYQPSVFLPALVTVLICISSVFLVLYLVLS